MINRKRPFTVRFGRLGLLLAGLLLAASCGSKVSDSTGGETHFLRSCEPSSNSCGPQLTCLCGVCTQLCSDRNACPAVGIAQCAPPIAAGACQDFRADSHCEVECKVDLDCSALSSSHHCEAGVCRAASACVRGQVSANQVLLIGDTFFAATHALTTNLVALARSSGALAPDNDAQYRDASTITTNSLAFAGNGIANQYMAAAANAPVKVVLMNGGGSDVLLGSCAKVDASCPVLAAAASAVQDLLSKMAKDGVQQVVYAFYPDPLDRDVQAKMDVLRPLVQSACQSSPVPCHWLDLRPTFAGQYAEYIGADGLNPTAAGSQASAAAIWAVMQQFCIAQ